MRIRDWSSDVCSSDLLRMHSDGPKRITLTATGPGEITASQVETGPDIEIMDPDHVLMTLDQGARVVMEMTVEMGKGYVPAAQNRAADAPIGLIPEIGRGSVRERVGQDV